MLCALAVCCIWHIPCVWIITVLTAFLWWLQSTMNGGITLPRIHNLLGLSAQYQMEPGSHHSTKESRSPQGRASLQRGSGSSSMAHGEQGRKRGWGVRCIRCWNLIRKAKWTGSDVLQRCTGHMIAICLFSNVLKCFYLVKKCFIFNWNTAGHYFEYSSMMIYCRKKEKRWYFYVIYECQIKSEESVDPLYQAQHCWSRTRGIILC